MEDVAILETLANLTKMVYTAYSYRAWIGLFDDENSWRWSISNTSFYKDGEMEFRSWATNQPNEYATFEYCVRTDASGKWHDFDCKMSFKVICSDVEGQNVTFVYININLNWTAAQDYCREHHTDLASVRNKMENDRISKLIPVGQFAWIGLSRSTWKWVDGRKPSLNYWSNNEPNGAAENCGVGYFGSGNSGRWEDWQCAHKIAFVCFSDSRHVVKLKLVRSSAVNLNDTTVQEDILKQLMQKLLDQEGKENFKLSWKKQSDGNVFYTEKKKDEI
ncbi:lymphocyte antigen 75-like [Girardinichthys multiradiatus]|uniref:lymphocyte antigen 75-like n=1 Tax=Girardinichthys multiradiatus TaxID=208333 RepID=UPI001FAB4E54|nr:lymphocyte antigen 75-like [Girardinichthys multiradiatus]